MRSKQQQFTLDHLDFSDYLQPLPAMDFEMKTFAHAAPNRLVVFQNLAGPLEGCRQRA